MYPARRFIYLLEKQSCRERERERKRESSPLAVTTRAEPAQSQKPGAYSRSPRRCRGHVGPLSTVPRVLAEIRSRAAKTQTSAYEGCWHHRWWIHQLLNKASPRNILYIYVCISSLCSIFPSLFGNFLQSDVWIFLKFIYANFSTYIFLLMFIIFVILKDTLQMNNKY